MQRRFSIAALKRHWGVALLIVMAAAVSPILYLQLRPEQFDLPVYEYADSPRLGLPAGRTRCHPSTLARIRNQIEAARERERCAEEAEVRALQYHSLIQQIRSADAAQAQAWVEHEMAWMTTYATIAGFLTLLAAAAAAFYARGAALAAIDNLDHARITSHADLRPWVDMNIRLESAALYADELIMSCVITLRNIGRTPAQNIRICHRAAAIRSAKRTDVDLFDNSIEGEVPARRAAILPGGEHNEEELVTVAWRMSEAEVTDEIVALVGISVTYDLPDGRRGKTAYSYWVGLPGGEGVDDLMPILRSAWALQDLRGLHARRANQTRVE